MGATQELENKLKEILYRCLEEIRATKAALYLEDSEKAESFRLVTSYGFKGGLKEAHLAREDLVNQLIVKRGAFFLNELTEDSRFSQLLYDADTNHLLAAPIYSRGRLVGFLDLRDKAAGEPFTHDDVTKAQGIADSYLELFAELGLYGQKKIAVADDEEVVAGDEASRSIVRPAGLDGEGPVMPPIVDRASSAISRGALRPRAKENGVDPLAVASDFLGLFLMLPAVVFAGVTRVEDGEVSQRIVAGSDVSDDAVKEFQRRLATWFDRRGQRLPSVDPAVEVSFSGEQRPPVSGQRVSSLMSAPFASVSSMVLSVVFEESPSDRTRREMESFLKRIDTAVDAALSAAAHDAALENVAARLIEPDLASLPDLKDHSKRVATLARDLARAIGLSESEIRDVWLAGLVHDVGSRPLGWEKLQRRGHLTDSEMEVVRKHPVVGAAMVARTALGPRIGRIVYSHHEWVNGEGYPDGASGDQIPIGARIIHICEAFDAMTAEHSYKPPISADDAVSRIRESAGKQFDEQLVEPFARLVL